MDIQDLPMEEKDMVKKLTQKFVITKYPEIECFFHDLDECVLTSKNKIWNNVGKELTEKSICVMPERVNQIPKNCLGVCTDFPKKYKNLF